MVVAGDTLTMVSGHEVLHRGVLEVEEGVVLVDRQADQI